MKMYKELYDWLEFRYKHDNHSKYHKYFEEWITNITENQIEGFNNQFNSKLGQDYIWKY